ncbi:MAG: helix-turn-helix domain-containing protein [Nevskia sp.]|nr:helix-turn-helix domain-containing protein [Nevskia sp.]
MSKPSELGALPTLAQTAELLRVSGKTVRRMIKYGAVKCHYICRQIRFTEEDVRRFLIKSIT